MHVESKKWKFHDIMTDLKGGALISFEKNS